MTEPPRRHCVRGFTWREQSALEDEQVELTRTEARAGQSNHVTRYVLGISLVLIVIVFTVIVVVGAASQ